MLYSEERYEDVIRVWDDYFSRGVVDQKYPRDIIVLVMGALYKIVSQSALGINLII